MSMKQLKQQWIDPPFLKCEKIQHIQSAFRPYKQEQEQEIDNVDMSFDIEAYINKRKFENSFTLSDITVSSFRTKKQQIKIQSRQQTPETTENQLSLIKSQQPVRPLFIVSQVQYSYIPKIKPIAIKRLYQQTISLKYLPPLKQLKDYGIQVQEFHQQKRVRKQTKLQEFCTSNQSSAQNQKTETFKKSKKQQKRQKINDKKMKKSGKKQQKRQNESNKNTKTQIKNQGQNHSSKQELTSDFPFQGVLRNCDCCGKLISKLCFKCPHLYCKAQNCPRKRKKLLNEKMLQKMKEQKIKQHYRQRQLYERMKLQQGDSFNKNIVYSQKIQQKDDKLESKRNNKNKSNKNNIQQTQNQWKTSSEEYQSQIIFDSEQEDEKSKQRNKIHLINQKNQKRTSKQKTKQDKVVNKKISIQNKDSQNNNKFIKNQEEKKYDLKKYNQLQKVDSFQMSLFISSDQSNDKIILEKFEKKKQSKQLLNRKKSQQNQQSFKFLNNFNKKSNNNEFYFDQDLESTF